MYKIIFWVLACWWLAPLTAQGQPDKYWIFLKDKNGQHYDYRQHLSEQTIRNRQKFGLPLEQYTDIPVNQEYVKAIEGHSVNIVCQSKWLNAVSAVLSAEQAAELRRLPFVSEVRPMRPGKPLSSAAHAPHSEQDPEQQYGSALQQIGASQFAKAGLNGEGVVIGVIDAGFLGAKDNPFLAHLFAENRILGVKDMLNPQRKDPYNGRETSSDDHGNTVLQMITGHAKGQPQYGLATKAKFYLARTDHGDREFRAEEDYWVSSMEWMDSLGVRLINTSLGYANGFDDPNENYKPDQMDGKSSVVSRAAQIAAEEKGILLVVSAGNEGSEYDWQVVSAPADAPGVLAVGATNNSGLKAYYSSIGPEKLSYLKPNVACAVQVMAGTSFSAPVITGLAACLMQQSPDAPSKQVFEVIEQSGQLYPFGNNFLGYGVPSAATALALLKGNTKAAMQGKEEVRAKEFYTLKKLKTKGQKVVAFHKANDRIVLVQDFVEAEKGVYTIKPKKDAQRTTVVCEEVVIEIIWE